MKSKPLSIKKYIASFFIDTTENCVAIATIKALLNIYTLEEIVQIESIGKYQSRITLRDGFTTTLSTKEVLYCARQLKVNANNKGPHKSTIDLLFAIMIKRLVIENGVLSFWNGRGIRAANIALSRGESYDDGVKWLGIKGRKITENVIPKYQSVIGGNSYNCFFIADNMYDRNGIATPIDEIVPGFERLFLLGLNKEKPRKIRHTATRYS